MQEFGVWSAAAGGFIETGLWSDSDAVLDEHVANGEDLEDLSVVEICPEHPEQPKHGCDECESDGEEPAEDE